MSARWTPAQQLSTAVDPTAGRRETNELRTTAGLRYDGADDLRPYRHLYDRRGYLNEIGTSRKYRGRVIVITQRMSAWRFFCLHAFCIFRKDKMSLIQSKCVYFQISLYWGGGLCPLPRPHPHHNSKLSFISKMWNLAKQNDAYQEGTKIDAEMNEWVLKNIGRPTH